MKIFILLFFFPVLATAQGIDRISETERIIINNNGTISTEVRTYKKEGNREWTAECDEYIWKSPWNDERQLKCNWTENQAMTWALNHAPVGLKIEWNDQRNRSRGEMVVFQNRALSNQGWCRDIYTKKFYPSNFIDNVYIMCQDQAGAWKSFRGH